MKKLVLAIVLSLAVPAASASTYQCPKKVSTTVAILSTMWIGAAWAITAITPAVGVTLFGTGIFMAKNVADDCEKS